jgi:predicted P-loop ATPase
MRKIDKTQKKSTELDVVPEVIKLIPVTNESVTESEEIQAINKANDDIQGEEKNDMQIAVDAESMETQTSLNIRDDVEKDLTTQIDRVETFLSSKYLFRHNIVSSKIEYQHLGKEKWTVMTDFKENSILRDCLKGRLKLNMSTLRSLLYSDFCPLFHPFEDYFFNLPEYDETVDYITELANTVTTTNPELWKQCLRKWLVAMVACVLEEKITNQTVIVFSGKQGIGKTTWVESLVPKQLKGYLFSGTINPNNKDTLMQLVECILINLDELESLNKSEIGVLKEIITKTQIRMRKAYGHNNETMPRRASFIGSVNTAQFLNDTTGSRRFLCFEVENILYQHNIDIDLVFAQALHLFKNGFKYWFDQEEIKSISANNEQYQLRSPEEELLLTWFEPVTKGIGCDYFSLDGTVISTLPIVGSGAVVLFLNATQIATKLSEKTKLITNDGVVNKLGKALTKHKFLRLKKKGITVYAVRERSSEEVDSKNKEVDEE